MGLRPRDKKGRFARKNLPPSEEKKPVAKLEPNPFKKPDVSSQEIHIPAPIFSRQEILDATRRFAEESNRGILRRIFGGFMVHDSVLYRRRFSRKAILIFFSLIILLAAAIYFLFIFEKNKPEPQPITALQKTNEFLLALSESPKNKDYELALKRLNQFILQMIIDDPFYDSDFQEQVIDIAIKRDSVIAGEVAKYANDKVSAEAKAAQKTAVTLQAVVSDLQLKIEEKNTRISELETITAKMTKKVPVLLVNKWATTLAVFKIAKQGEKEEQTFTVDDAEGTRNGELEIFLEPGTYQASIYEDDDRSGSLYCKTSFTVRLDPENKNDKYYRTVITPD